LNHPNILAVFQMGTYEGAPYLVSELLEGEALREPIKRGRLSVGKAIDYGMQITQGLAAETGLLIPSVFGSYPACFGTLRLRYCGPGANNLRLKIYRRLQG
jgi:serine/threonine protein kinase